MMYEDHDRNIVHHFNVPGRHSRLTLTAQALVECGARPELPSELPTEAWRQLDAMTASGSSGMCSRRAGSPNAPTHCSRWRDPSASDGGAIHSRPLRDLMAVMYREFEYSPAEHARRLAHR
jgi:hypothetical protein